MREGKMEVYFCMITTRTLSRAVTNN